jgi:ferredoxin
MSEQNSLKIAGRYYVDETCVHCDLCHEIAPEHFAIAPNGEGFVCKQPSNDGEERQCQSAKVSCPVGAIQDDGQT